MEEHDTPVMEDLGSSYPHSYVEREKLEDSSNSLAPKELVEPVKKKLDEYPAKRRYMMVSRHSTICRKE